MKVLIVAKTRQGSRACVGGITDEGQSVRLRAADYDRDESAGLEYEVGDVWEIEAKPAPSPTPPHIENIVVCHKRQLGPAHDLVGSIERFMPPVCGGPELLFEGLAQATDAGSLYIAERSGLPSHSTMFWRPDQPLQRECEGRRIRYRYPTADGGRTLVYVGFQDSPLLIPAGTLLRVSLAHWWRPEASTDELRCYVQLSGWFDLARDVTPASDFEPATAPKPDLEKARCLLKSVFGYDDFRPLQAEVIANLCAGHDSLAIMPTGSGKSLCYQLPALLWDGLTLVISPLISLMQDQVAQLKELGIPAACLNGAVNYHEAVSAMHRARAGQLKLLYTSPETLLKPETIAMLDACHVACIAIDEAHCISEWGHDFRPEYRKLLPIRRRYPTAVCLACTATATHRVRDDIAAQLMIRPANVYTASFNRPNLYLQVDRRTDGLSQTTQFLELHRGQSGIIYCGTRGTVDRLAALLGHAGWSVLPYHAGMDDAQRRRNQEDFSHDRAQIIIATIAFGMGIDKSNVRFVLHHDLPDSIESYYQEIGRAGRDGLRADCLLLYSLADVYRVRKFIEKGAASERRGRNARLNAMLEYAEAHRCRRKLLLGYFGEAVVDERCGFCDICHAAPDADAQTLVDVSAEARLLLDAIRATGEMFGPAYIADVLRGSRSGKITGRQHDRLPQHGSGRQHPASYWRELADQLVIRDVLVRDPDHGSLRLTGTGRQVLQGATLAIPLPPARQPAPPEPAPHDPVLFEQLRSLRRSLAEQEQVPPYVVFSDRTLVELATQQPCSVAALLNIHGIGNHKLHSYGQEVLEVICSYLEREPPALDAKPEQAKPAERPLSGRSAEVGRLFLEGRSLAELTAAYQVKAATIISHLENCVQDGWRLPPERVLAMSQLAAEDRQAVLEKYLELGDKRLTPVFEALGGRIAYDELHILRLYHRVST